MEKYSHNMQTQDHKGALVNTGKNARKYYDTFKPFLGKEKSRSLNKNVNIMTEGNRIENEERKVAE